MARACVLASALIAGSCVAGVGFQQVAVPERDGKSMPAGIWYPSNVEASPHPLGMFSQDVAVNGPIVGYGLPLILISHGTGGSLSSHIDTALALARAGFVVVAITHTGDNYQDQSYTGNRRDLIERPRHIKIALDWMLSSWVGRDGLKVHPDAHLVEGADHFVFLAPCSESLAAAAPQICRDQRGFDRTAFHRIFNQAAVDFFTANLRER
jgi:predicted dienelactone hydrolase